MPTFEVNDIIKSREGFNWGTYKVLSFDAVTGYGIQGRAGNQTLSIQEGERYWVKVGV